MSYTLAKVAEPWRSLFPTVKENASSVEVTVRGQTFKIEIPKKQLLVSLSRNLQYH